MEAVNVVSIDSTFGHQVSCVSPHIEPLFLHCRWKTHIQTNGRSISIVEDMETLQRLSSFSSPTRSTNLRGALCLSLSPGRGRTHYPSSAESASSSSFSFSFSFASASASSAAPAAADLPKSRVARLMGIGKMMVELCSAAMLFSVCR